MVTMVTTVTMVIMERENINKMKDMHNHILFSIDDGSKDIETSIRMLKKAEQDGIDEMILTPHYIYNTKYNADNKKKLELLEELKKRCVKEGINIKLYLGNEVWADEGLPELIKKGENDSVISGEIWIEVEEEIFYDDENDEIFYTILQPKVNPFEWLKTVNV